MSDTISEAGSPGPALQDILVRLVTDVRHDIDALPDSASERVHDIRVGMKRFRAVMRLAGSVLLNRSLVRADKLARQLKEHFASTRDNDVLRALLQDLLKSREASETAKSLGLSAATSEAAAVADPVAGAICRRLTKFAEGLNLDGLRGRDVREAWVSTYRAARRAMKRCSENQDDDALFHAWRKRVKELLYQSAVLEAIPAAEGIARHAQELSSLLGAHHDLAVLCERLAEALPGSHAEVAARARKDDFVRRALEAGAELLAAKPSRLRSA